MTITRRGVKANASVPVATPIVPVALGGTGATTADAAKVALEIGTAADYDASAFAQAVHSHAGTDITTLIIENRTSDPGSPETGRIWLRTDL